MTQSIFAARPYNLKLNQIVVFRRRNPLTVKNRNSLIRSPEKTLPSCKISGKDSRHTWSVPDSSLTLTVFQAREKPEQTSKPQTAIRYADN
jgi:hypothetical protein